MSDELARIEERQRQADLRFRGEPSPARAPEIPVKELVLGGVLAALVVLIILVLIAMAFAPRRRRS